MAISDPHLLSILHLLTPEGKLQNALDSEMETDAQIDLSLIDEEDEGDATAEFDFTSLGEQLKAASLNTEAMDLDSYSVDPLTEEKVEGGCHCKAIRFSAIIPSPSQLIDCNCSICLMKGIVHCIIPFDAFTLHASPDALSTYQFNTHQAHHLFCSHCGIASFYIPRSHPNHISINARCLDQAESVFRRAQVQSFDGQNWDAEISELNADYDPTLIPDNVEPTSTQSSSPDHTLDESISEDDH